MLIIVFTMRQTLEVVKQIELNTLKLIQKQKSLKKDLSEIKLENENLKAEKKMLEKSINVLETENEQLKSVNAILGSNEFKRETKLKINRMIREIDSCITQLSD